MPRVNTSPALSPFKVPEAVEVIRRLAADADVVVENWRPDVKQRLGPQVGNDHPTSSPMGMFEASDGLLNSGASGEGTWQRFCEIVDKPEWLRDPDFTSEALRVRNRMRLNAAIQELFHGNTVSHWVDLLNKGAVPAGPVYSIPQVFEDAQVQHLQTVCDLTSSRGPAVRVITQPVCLGRTPASVERSAPEWGEHTDEILREAGYDNEQISGLRSRGVI